MSKAGKTRESRRENEVRKVSVVRSRRGPCGLKAVAVLRMITKSVESTTHIAGDGGWNPDGSMLACMRAAAEREPCVTLQCMGKSQSCPDSPEGVKCDLGSVDGTVSHAQDKERQLD